MLGLIRLNRESIDSRFLHVVVSGLDDFILLLPSASGNSAVQAG